jgi:hypothetical protein
MQAPPAKAGSRPSPGGEDMNAVDMNATMNASEIENVSANASAPAGADHGAETTAPPVPAPAPAGVRKGLGAFVDPGDMEIDNWVTVEFVVGPDTAAITEETEGQPLTTPHPVFLSETMRVTLLPDPNFEIRPQSAAVQDTGPDMTATWQWKVKPSHGGNATLYAKVEVGTRQPDGSLAVARTYTRRVAVHVKVGTWKGFLNALRNASTLGEVLNTLFSAWEKTLLALAALIAAASGVWMAIKKWGKPKEG